VLLKCECLLQLLMQDDQRVFATIALACVTCDCYLQELEGGPGQCMLAGLVGGICFLSGHVCNAPARTRRFAVVHHVMAVLVLSGWSQIVGVEQHQL
jgi:hypothetical protein